MGLLPIIWGSGMGLRGDGPYYRAYGQGHVLEDIYLNYIPVIYALLKGVESS